jgi:hypothetical protein
MRGYQRDESVYLPQHKKIKMPFGRSMIRSAYLLVLSTYKDRVLADAIHAALCMGFMFLFRKSEYLTGPDRKLAATNGVVAPLQAGDVHFWYNNTPYSADQGSKIPPLAPDLISMYLYRSKCDQFGKGATRFFPSQPLNPQCMVRVVHAYCRTAGLRPTDALFAGPRVLVTAAEQTRVLKDTPIQIGIPSDQVSLHSLRIGGLVALFAANVPDSLKQLAGRWASPTLFIIYARATMQQFGQIADALNDVDLVTADHVKMFYTQHRSHNNAFR